MKNIIKKLLITLLISLVLPTVAISQITLDSTEAKETAIIFAEHEKLTIENSLLKEQILSLEELNNLCEQSDSIHTEEIGLYKEQIEFDKKQIKKLKSSHKTMTFGSILGGAVLFILGLLL